MIKIIFLSLLLGYIITVISITFNIPKLLLFVLGYFLFVWFDIYTTIKFLKLGGREANVIGRFIFDKLGLFWGSILSKNIFILFVLLLFKLDNGSKEEFYFIFSLILSSGIVVVLNNIIMIKRLIENRRNEN